MLDQQVRFLDKCRSSQVQIQTMELIGRNHEKAGNRFLASTRTQFNGHHNNLRNFINPLRILIHILSFTEDKG